MSGQLPPNRLSKGNSGEFWISDSGELSEIAPEERNLHDQLSVSSSNLDERENEKFGYAEDGGQAYYGYDYGTTGGTGGSSTDLPYVNQNLYDNDTGNNHYTDTNHYNDSSERNHYDARYDPNSPLYDPNYNPYYYKLQKREDAGIEPIGQLILQGPHATMQEATRYGQPGFQCKHCCLLLLVLAFILAPIILCGFGIFGSIKSIQQSRVRVCEMVCLGIGALMIGSYLMCALGRCKREQKLPEEGGLDEEDDLYAEESYNRKTKAKGKPSKKAKLSIQNVNALGTSIHHASSRERMSNTRL